MSSSIIKLQDYESLKEECWRYDLKGFVPHPTQNIKSVYDIILHLSGTKKSEFNLPDIKCDNILVLALDSISFLDSSDYIEKHLGNAFVKPLTSTFPSTSISSWASMFLGLHPNEHGFYGPAFYEKELNKVIGLVNSVIYSDNVVTSPFPLELANSIRLTPPEATTIFEKLEANNWDTYLMLDYALAKSYVWIQEITRGTHLVKNFFSENKYYEFPEMLTEGLNITEELIHNLKDNNNLIWSFINFDPYVHNFHLPADKKDYIFKTIAEFIRKLNIVFHKEKWCVLIVSDHGQIIQDINSNQIEQYNSLINNNLTFKYPQGGAGRVRWTYPKAGKEDYVFERVKDIVGNDGIILHKEELWEKKLFPTKTHFKDYRVGEIIALANNHQFPSYGHTLFAEHGSITEREMFVPFAICYPG